MYCQALTGRTVTIKSIKSLSKDSREKKWKLWVWVKCSHLISSIQAELLMIQNHVLGCPEWKVNDQWFSLLDKLGKKQERGQVLFPLHLYLQSCFALSFLLQQFLFSFIPLLFLLFLMNVVEDKNISKRWPKYFRFIVWCGRVLADQATKDTKYVHFFFFFF